MKFLIRRVYHANETETKKAERFITNCLYVNKLGRPVTLYPVPDCTDNKCKVCGKEGFGMDEHMAVYCIDCLEKLFNKTELVKEKALATPSVEQSIKANAFEWQPQGKNDNWYKIRGVNIVPDCQHPLAKKIIKDRFYELMSEVLEDNPQLVDGEYIKEEKKLVIWI